MSPMLWLKQLFMPQDAPDARQDINELPGLEDEPSFVFGQHLRILLAILIAVLAAFCMWWIVA